MKVIKAYIKNSILKNFSFLCITYYYIFRYFRFSIFIFISLKYFVLFNWFFVQSFFIIIYNIVYYVPQTI